MLGYVSKLLHKVFIRHMSLVDYVYMYYYMYCKISYVYDWILKIAGVLVYVLALHCTSKIITIKPYKSSLQLLHCILQLQIIIPPPQNGRGGY